jgi:hypothetical protein
MYVSFGAFVAAWLTKGASAGIHRAKALLPDHETKIHERVAFLMAFIIGSIGGYVLYDGNDGIRAIATGASAVAVLRQMTGNK